MIISSGMRLTPARLSMPTGRVSASLAAASAVTVAVSFGRTFATPPRVGVNVASTSFSSSNTTDARAISVTTTGFTLVFYTVDGGSITATAVPIDWWAIPA